jgi:hypothetical protein
MSQAMSRKTTLLIAAGLNTFGGVGLLFTILVFFKESPSSAVMIMLCAPCLVIGTWLNTAVKCAAAHEAASSEATETEGKS